MLAPLLRIVPPSLVQRLGKLQFAFPRLGRVLRTVAHAGLNREGVIVRGFGKGLKFDPTGGFPGMVLGTTEPREQALLAQHLEPGGVFYDIGANIGFYTTLAGRAVGETGQVYAFEPFAETARRCRANALRNGFEHVTVVQNAVSSCQGAARLILGDGLTQSRVDLNQGDLAEREAPVELITIDAWRKTTGARLPSVVMIDAEGQEIEVLKGMAETLAAARPVLMIEVHWLGQPFVDYIQSNVVPLGYEFTTYEGEPLKKGPVRYHALGLPL